MRYPSRIFYALVLSSIITGAFMGCDKDDPEVPVIPYETVNGFVINEEGEKLLATSNGLYSFNEVKSKFELIDGDTPPPPLKDLALSNTSPLKELWIASYSGAFNYSSWYFVSKANSGLHSDEVNRIHWDQENNLFLATPAGVSIFSQQEWILTQGQDDLFLKHKITDMGTATNGYTYVTTHGGGIERFTIDVDGVSGATLYDTDWTQLESNNILTVFIDDTVQAYGTDQGAALHFSEYTKWDWEVFTTNDGLINDTVLAIVKDHSNNWWFGTNRGISRLSGSEWTGYSVETHSIISNQVKFLAMAPDGSVWMATDLGLSKFENEQWVSYLK